MTDSVTSQPVPEILTFGAAEAARRLRAGEFSSTELVQAVLARIEAVNPTVNAIREVLDKEALHAAGEADRRLLSGSPSGPLDGVPVTVKDNIDVSGTATTQGVAAFAGETASADAPSIANLRQAGAIPVAHTNMPDFALRWHTDSGISGPTLNPWDAELTPGGSSGGEAVSLATGMSLLGVGNDLGGSVRWPSQCAGTAALRPTLGRIPHAQSIEPITRPISIQLMDVQGPMARSVEDLRLAFAVMAEPDARDPWHCPIPASYAPAAPRRVHVLSEMNGVEYDASVVEALRRGATALADQGYEISEDVPPGIEEAAGAWATLMASDARRGWPAFEPIVSPGGKQLMELIFELVPAIGLDEYAELLATRQRLARAWSELQRTTPLVLAPIYAGRAFRAGGDVDGLATASEIVDNFRATLMVNFLGLPSAAIPVGLVDGLPQAVQVIGPRFGEELCLRAAEAIETASDDITPINPSSWR